MVKGQTNETCVQVSPSGDDATVESADGMKEPEPAEPEPLRAKVGEWEDILGSGRLRLELRM